MNGDEIYPESGELTINVTINIPSEKDQSFDGELVLVNEQDGTDFEIIPVTISTSNEYEKVHHFQVVQKIWFMISEFLSQINIKSLPFV
jgi:hypothetical protein